MTIAMLKRIGLFGGPLLGLLCYYLLPLPVFDRSWRVGRVHASGARHACLDGLDGRVVAHRGGGYRGHRSPADRDLPAAGHSAPQQSPAALRCGRDFPLHGRLHHRACHRALGSRPAHGLLHLAPGRGASGRNRRRLHGGHRVPEHVGLEYRVRGHDGADRAERRRPGTAQPYRRRPEGIRGDPAGPRSGAQLRHRPAALHRVRGIDRRDRDHHRFATQRYRRALHRADIRART